MNSQIKIYKNCEITEQKQFKVDEIETYLATLTNTLTLNDFQYIKKDLEIEIKVDMSQFGLKFSNSENYNYVSVKNVDENLNDVITYYFVVHKKWTSQTTIKFSLKMDTINSFLSYIDGVGLSFNKKTKIIREHKDRWELVSTPHTSPYTISPIIDFYSEGFQPNLYKSFEEKVLEKTNTNIRWYLAYMNAQSEEEATERPIECYLYTSSSVVVPASEFYGRVISFASLDGEHYCMYYGDVGAINITTYSNDGQTSTVANIWTLNSIRTYNGEDYYIKGVWWSYSNIYSRWEIDLILQKVGASSVVFETINAPSGTTYDKIATAGAIYRKFDDNQLMQYYPYVLDNMTNIIHNGKGHGEFTTPVITSLDRTDSRIVKVIELPYCPSQFFQDTSKLYDTWIPNYENGGKLRLINTSLSFSNTFDGISSHNPFSAYVRRTLGAISPTALRSSAYETKLFHSDFYQPRIIYDSFVFSPSMEFMMDSVDMKDAYDHLQITFTPTTTINSRFLFTFDKYLTTKSMSNYDNVLSVQRNNELTLYNNEYINYVRTGFNYDQKSKTIKELNLWTGSAGSIVNGAMSGGWAGAVLGWAGGMYNAIMGTIEAENTFAKKIEQTRWQTTSVGGSDDIDLLNKYNGNKLVYSLYEVSSKMKSLLNDYFYYYGYIGNRYGVPNLATRYWFNYIQCEAVFNRLSPNISDEIIEDAVDRLRNGITILHKNKVSGVDTWDFEQVYENWETNIMNDL